MNGEVCCILGVCCPPLSAEQSDALAREMVKDGACADMAEAQKLSVWILTNFDLAPSGTLAPFKKELAKIIRKHDDSATKPPKG